uniref:Plexin b2b n=1 Tax=Astyanax mexicanus TaxID=7994 RepID=A0A8B9L920_ASTMX
MAGWVQMVLFLLWCVFLSESSAEVLEFPTDTRINNVVQDPATGRVYLGAVNTIYQLDAFLKLEARAETGPKKDARTCTPPVSACTTADLKDTNNINKLLLVHHTNGSLIVCGSVYKGICSLLNLSNVNQEIYYSDTKGERTYAASTDENISVVGVMATFLLKENPDKKTFPVFLIAKAHGGPEDNPKLIATRILENYKEWVVFESIVEASPVQVFPHGLKYQHQFRFAFKDSDYIYFLFSRTRDESDNKNFTFLSRLCERDESYYSYTELQLNCSRNGVQYNKVQAAYVTEPGKELARAMLDSGQYGTVSVWDKVLFIVASPDGEDATDSALCMYPLKRINERVEDILNACYTDYGKIGGRAAVYSPYKSITDNPCQNHHTKEIVDQNKCGAEFLRYPLASRPQFALQAEAVFSRQGRGHLTAVAVAVENDHTIAFLGSSVGEVVKVTPTEHLHCQDSNERLTVDYHHINRVEVASREFDFYNCAAAIRKAENTPCQSRPWACQWNTADHTCSDMNDNEKGPNIIKHKQAKNCPRFENPDPVLIPVGFKTRISFEGVNLGAYKEREFTIGTELMKQVEDDVKTEEGPFFSFGGYMFAYDKTQETSVLFHIKDKDTEKKIDSTLNVTLYNCSLGREDCSLCKNADPKYQCVWCARTRSCVFEKLCTTDEAQECPDPGISAIIPRYGPILGGISVTIKGSNLGIQKEDIKSITVAGVPCTQQEEKYSVSTSVVCEIGAVENLKPFKGLVEVEVKGGKKGTSSVYFNYRDPKPEAVHPNRGPRAGGTVITITGTNLDTGSKEDVVITVDGVPCPVEEFGEKITCKVGPYRGEKVPSDLLPVVVHYGKYTSTQVSSAFQFFNNPVITDHQPRHSFDCGGRQITVIGSGFALIQRASIRVQVADEWSGLKTRTTFVQEAVIKNDTTLQFPSPVVKRMYDSQSFTMSMHLDNVVEKLSPFEYHSNPEFYPLSNNVIIENSVFIVTGRGFSKAMTAKEALAFVGDVSCNVNTLQDDKLFLDPPSTTPSSRSKRQRRDIATEPLDLLIKFGHGEWVVGSVHYERKYEVKLDKIIIPAVVVPMLLIIAISIVCYRRKSQQAEREYEKVKHQLENLEESVRDRCKKEFTDLMIEMEDHTNDLSEGRIPFLDYKTYTDRVFFLPSKDGANDVMITGKLDIPESRKAIVAQALNQFSNLLNSKTFLITFIRTLEARPDFNARAKVYCASLLTVALHGKLEYYTDIMRTLLLGLMEEYVQSKNPKLMLQQVYKRMCLHCFFICLQDSAGEPLYKLFRAIKHQIEKGPVDAQVKKAKYTLNDTGLLGDDVEYSMLTLQVLVQGEGPDITPVKVLDCDTISQVKEKIIEQVYKNLPYSQRPKVESVTLEWRPGSTGQILSDLDVTSQKEGRWRRLNTLAHYNVRDNATLVLSRLMHTQQSYYQNHDNHEERNALLEDDKVFHLVRPADELDEMKSKRGSIKDKSMTKAITEIYLTRLLSVKGTLQQFVDDFFRSVLCSGTEVPPAVKYFFDFLDEQALKHDNVDEETIHIWKTNSLPLRFWVNILKNPHFIFDVHVTEVVDASLSVIAQTFMDACTKSEHKLSRDSPSNKLLYAKEISSYKKMVDEYYKGIRVMVPVSDQDMNTHLAEVSRAHTDKLNTQVALHQLYQYASKYYKEIVLSLDEDPAAQSKQLTFRLQQIAAALENKVTDL